MKTALDIRHDYPGTQTRTFGRARFYTCEVIMPDGEILKGLGTTLESAEDTAWYAVKITLRETITV